MREELCWQAYNKLFLFQVRLAFTLSSVQDLNSAEQKMSIVGFLAVRWQDEFLTWTKASYGGISTINVFQNEIWRPRIFLGSPLDEFNDVGFPFLTMTVTDIGLVTWIPPGIFTFGCTVDVEYYPFDTQTCYLEFAVNGYSINEVTLVAMLSHVNLDQYSENVEWELLSADSMVYTFSLQGVQSQVFRNTLTLKRRPTFVIIHSVVPILLLSILNILVFVLPVESGEKISLSITLFLAFAIFLTMLSESLPKNSVTLPIFSIYLISINILSTLYVIMTVAVLNIYHQPSDVRVPSFLQLLTTYSFCRQQPRGSKVNHLDDDRVKEALATSEKATDGHIADNKMEAKRSDTKQVTWIDVARVLDKMFAWIVFVVLAIITITFGSLWFSQS